MGTKANQRMEVEYIVNLNEEMKREEVEVSYPMSRVSLKFSGIFLVLNA